MHLIGLHKLKDLQFQRYSKARLFDFIMEDKISLADLKKSVFYREIEDRILYFPLLEKALDSNELIIKYNKGFAKGSVISASFILIYPYNDSMIHYFVEQEQESGLFYGKSFFVRQDKKYIMNQQTFKVIKKAKLDTSSKTKKVLLDRPLKPLLWMLYAPEDAEKNRWYIEEHRRICQGRGWQFEMILTTRLSVETGEETRKLLPNGGPPETQKLLLDGRPIQRLPDRVISRQRDWQLSRAFEENGCRVFNSSALCRLGNDKWRSLEAVRALGLPVPASCLTDYDHVADNPLGYPVVVKSLDGHGGSQVFWAENREQLGEAAAKIKGKILLQRPVDTPGKDLRVYVLNDQIIGAVLRQSGQDFRSNYSLGGSVSAHNLTPEERRMAERIIAMEHMDLAGIDFMYHEGKPVFNEIEDVAGARMLYKCTDIPLVENYVDHVLGSFS